MLAGPDWNKLFANGNCLYYGEPRSDEQRAALDSAKSPAEREELVKKFREEYMKKIDLSNGKLLESEAEVIEKPAEIEEVEKSNEDVKPVKPSKKKGK